MSEPVIYPWERQWLPIVSSPDRFEPPYQFEQSGYVVSHRLVAGPKLLSEPIGLKLDSLTEKQICVVLLGEPGMGKSQEWAAQQARLGATPHHLFLNLGRYSSEDRLERKIQQDPQVLDAQATKSVLTLWLDSLDEGQLHMHTLQETLLDILRSLRGVQLRLRITCRNAVWQPSFATALTALLTPAGADPKDTLAVWLLNPLSQYQVQQAAETEGFDSTQFLHAVAEADAQPLAGRPVTLGLLIRLFRRYQPHFGEAGPTSRSELYERGCLELCERPDRQRPDQHRPADARPRLLLAGHLAMVMIMTNRRLIYSEPVSEGLLAHELDPYALGGGKTAAWQHVQATVDQAGWRDLFKNTGLFTDLGTGRMMWAHQSYAEFLAAWYLNLTAMPTGSLRPLFRSTADSSGGIVPALLETAAWLADLQPTFWDEMLALDPTALLQADLRRLTDAQRTKLVARLLQWFRILAGVPYQRSGFLTHLCHPDLASQLVPVLSDVAPPTAASQFAVELAGYCKLPALLPFLVSQTLDATIPYQVRRRALYILSSTADNTARDKLRALLGTLPPEDEDGQFLDELLHILWPTHLSIDELLPILTDRKRQRRRNRTFSSYFNDFITSEFAPTRTATLASLCWLTAKIPQPDWVGQLEELWEKGGTPYWQQVGRFLDDEDVFLAFANLFVAAGKRHRQPLLVGDQAQRLRLFTHLMKRPDRPDPWQAIYHLQQGESLVSLADWEQLLPLLHTRLSKPARAWLTEVLTRLLRPGLAEEDALSPCYTERFAELYLSVKQYPSSWAVFLEWRRPERVKSKSRLESRKWQLQDRTRKRKELRKKLQRRRTTLRFLVKRRQRINELLEQAAVETLQPWWALLYYVSPQKVKEGRVQLYDATEARGWAKLTPAQQTTCVDWACTLVAQYTALPTEWGGFAELIYQDDYDDAWVLYRAYLICLRKRPEFLSNLPSAFWHSWSHFLMKFGRYTEVGLEFTPLQPAAAAEPALVAEVILRAIQASERSSDSRWYYFQELYQALPGNEFPHLLLQAVTAGTWREEFAGLLLADMLAAGYQPALAYAESLLPEPSLVGVPAKLPAPKLVAAAYSWLLFDQHSPADWWPWFERLSTQPALAEQVISAAIRYRAPQELPRLGKLTEEQLEAVIMWLTMAFSLTDAEVDDRQEKTRYGRLAALRSLASTELAARGTVSAWQTLQRLSDWLGTPYWLHRQLDQVRENLRRNSWEPIAPDALLILSREANRRWVRSADDLLDLIVESLSRFQTDLQGELNAAEQLWIPEKGPTNAIIGQTVHGENYLSNVIRRHLKQDIHRGGILLKREVEIQPSVGKGTGQRTDIHVDAFTVGPNGERQEEVTVVIEVKLSKNDEVETAINEQLIKYLVHKNYKHGLFLVGWHYGQYYPKPKKGLTLEELRLLLDQQATTAASAGYTLRAVVLDIRLPSDN